MTLARRCFWQAHVAKTLALGGLSPEAPRSHKNDCVRPKGSFKVASKRIQDMLKKHASPSCRYSRRLARPLEQLDGTLRALHSKDPAINGIVSYRTLARRNSRAKLGFSRAHKRTDLCDLCQQRDRFEGPAIKRAMALARNTLKACDPSFFDDWDEKVQNDVEWRKSEFSPETSPNYMHEWLLYIRGHRHNPELQEVVDAALTHFEGKAELLNRCRSWSAHFVLRDCQAALFKKHFDTPKEKTLYMMWDFEAPAMSLSINACME